MRGFRTSTGRWRVDVVIILRPLRYASSAYSWIVSTMTITFGRGHLRGSIPRSPGPRDTTGRMYASRSPLRRTVSMIARVISGRLRGIWIPSVCAESKRRSTCASSLKIRP